MGRTLYIGNDMGVSFSGKGKLTNKKGDPVTGATIEATLYEKGTATKVGGIQWPVVFADDGEGEYSAILEDTASIVSGSEYDLEIKAELNGAKGRWIETVTAAYRRFGR